MFPFESQVMLHTKQSQRVRKYYPKPSRKDVKGFSKRSANLVCIKSREKEEQADNSFRALINHSKMCVLDKRKFSCDNKFYTFIRGPELSLFCHDLHPFKVDPRNFTRER